MLESATAVDGDDAGVGRTARAERETAVPERASFALCLTHDVDRPYKRSGQSLFYALTERRVGHLRGLGPSHNPYWQFEEIMALEDARDVRSAFYFLNEPHILEKGARALLSPRAWVEHLGRYRLFDPAIADVVRRLEDGGWEVGLHGSLASATDRERLAEEKRVLETVVGDRVRGGRQHRLRLSRPGTWENQRAVGLAYDTTLGSATDTGFAHGYDPVRPFDDDFTVYPLTIMEQALPDPGTDFAAAWAVCEDLLVEAAENGAVMTVLWHPRYFNDEEFPGYRTLYERLLDTALQLGAWVGPPGDLQASRAEPEPLPAD